MGMTREQAICMVNNGCMDILTMSDWKQDSGVQLAAIKLKASNIQYIIKPCLEAQRLAVQSDGTLIRFIKNPNQQIQIMAVEQNIDSYRYIENPNSYTTQLYKEKKHA